MCYQHWRSGGEGVQGDNVGAALSEDDSFNLAAVYGMLILDSIIYMAIAWWVWPQYGNELMTVVVLGILMQCFPGSTVFLSHFISSSLHLTGWVGRSIRCDHLVVDQALRYVCSLYMYQYYYIIVIQMNVHVSILLYYCITDEWTAQNSIQIQTETAHEQEPTDLKCGISVKGLTKIYKVIASNRGFMVWRGETLANLANHLQFAKLKPSKWVVTLRLIYAFTKRVICQAFSPPNFPTMR